MTTVVHKLALAAMSCLLFTGLGLAQTSSLEGSVKGPDGKPMQGAQIRIVRKDIKGNYQVKTDKKGRYFHAGLPLGNYRVAVEVDGKEVESVDNVKTRLGDPLPIDFNLQQRAEQQAAMQKAAETGQLTEEQARDMTPEQKAALEKQVKERSAQLAKNKELNDAFNLGMEAIKTKDYATAITQLSTASKTEIGGAQHVVWGNLADAYVQSVNGKTGPEVDTALNSAVSSYEKAMELLPTDASYVNNYALALAKLKKYPEMQAALDKAAQLDPPNAGRYYYNLGAVLVNAGQSEPAGVAFKKAIDADPNYADAHYQYGIFLIGKSNTTPDGKVTAPEGTDMAFQKYLELKPDGPFAQSSKDMLTMMGSKLETSYKNPNAPAKGQPAPAKGKKK